ncbi:hypothetical protein [Actinokineospora enzanensis]|uniref:hypothetical protein n=1 Tax=Actinokineospora enzanensis TaxID=155975 RepID=UPI00035CACD4|nr:hypothetical protein [Actinokineospora enzanensis]
MTISRDEMEAHIRAGRARKWTHAVGPGHTVFSAAKLGDQWFVVLIGHTGYSPVTELLSTVLTGADKHYAKFAATGL